MLNKCECLWIRNWRTSLHMRRADIACALTR